MKRLLAVAGLFILWAAPAAAVDCPAGSAFELRRPSDNEPLGCIDNGGRLKISSMTINSVDYDWPDADGASNARLTTDGAGALSWTAGGGGDVTAAGDNTFAGSNEFAGEVNFSVWPSSTGILPPFDTTQTAYGPCVPSSTRTITTTGFHDVEIVMNGSMRCDVADAGCSLVYLCNGDFCGRSSNSAPFFPVMNVETRTNRNQPIAHTFTLPASDFSAGTLSVCMTTKASAGTVRLCGGFIFGNSSIDCRLTLREIY